MKLKIDISISLSVTIGGKIDFKDHLKIRETLTVGPRTTLEIILSSDSAVDPNYFRFLCTLSSRQKQHARIY